MRIAGREGLRRGVLLLPALFTLGNLFCGFYALMEATKGRWSQGSGSAAHFELAAVFIALAMLADGLDGRIARFAHATSPLGMQLDSLADVVSFGVAPGLLVYSWALVELPRPRLGWALAFVYVSCGALRLARFNVQVAVADSRYFVGLPIPGAAGTIAAVVFAHPEPPRDLLVLALAALGTLCVSFLMVSTIRYPSFKKMDVTRRRPLRALTWVVGSLALLASFPAETLLLMATVFTASGPLLRLYWLLRRRGGPEDAARSES